MAALGHHTAARLHSLCAKFTFSLAFLAFLKRRNLEAMSILELIHSLQTNSKRPQARLKHLGTWIQYFDDALLYFADVKHFKTHSTWLPSSKYKTGLC